MINVINHLVKYFIRVEMEREMEWNGNGMKVITKGLWTG